MGLSVSTLILVRPYTEHVVTNIYINSLSPNQLTPHQGLEKKFKELMEELHTFDHVGSGPRVLTEEVTIKDPVHYAVIMSNRDSSDVMRTLKNTWARDIDESRITYYFPSGKEVDVSRMNHNMIELPVERTSQEIQVLRHVCEHRLNATKWFFIGYDTAYIKTHELESYLLSLEASQNHFPYLGKPMKSSIGRVCMPGPGSVLSYLALAGLCPKLSSCMELEGNLKSESVLGECLHKEFPDIQCSKNGQPQRLFLRIDGIKKGPITDLGNESLAHGLTFYPVTDPKLMYNIHQRVISERLNKSQYLVQELKQVIDQMEKLLPQLELGPGFSQSDSDVVKTREAIMPWQLINHNLLMSKDDSAVSKLPPVWKHELKVLKDSSMDYLRMSQEDQQLVFSRVMNTYWRLNPLTGMDYLIDFEAKSSNPKENRSISPNHFQVALSRPFSQPEVSPIQTQVRDNKKVVIALVVTGDQEEIFREFMKGLGEVLEQDQRLDLVVVKMKGKDERQGSKKDSSFDSIIGHYEMSFLRASFRVIESSQLISRARGLSLVLKELRPSDITFFADIYFKFNTTFLERCRNLPLQGQQVYYPIPFAMSDHIPNTHNKSERDKRIGEGWFISPHSGYWLVKSYKTLCAYAADVLASVREVGSKGIPKEINTEKLYKGLFRNGYEVIRSLDSGLWRKYQNNSGCMLDFIGEIEDHCKDGNEPYPVLRTKIGLSEMMFCHEGTKHSEKF